MYLFLPSGPSSTGLVLDTGRAILLAISLYFPVGMVKDVRCFCEIRRDNFCDFWKNFAILNGDCKVVQFTGQVVLLKSAATIRMRRGITSQLRGMRAKIKRQNDVALLLRFKFREGTNRLGPEGAEQVLESSAFLFDSARPEVIEKGWQ